MDEGSETVLERLKRLVYINGDNNMINSKEEQEKQKLIIKNIIKQYQNETTNPFSFAIINLTEAHEDEDKHQSFIYYVNDGTYLLFLLEEVHDGYIKGYMPEFNEFESQKNMIILMRDIEFIVNISEDEWIDILSNESRFILNE